MKDLQQGRQPPRVLKIRARRCVTLVPTARVPDGAIAFSIGAFGPDGAFLDEFTLRRVYGCAPAGAFTPHEEEWLGDHIFGGVFFPHYGHFLTESLARSWAFDQFPDLPIVWHVHPGARARRLHAWQEEVLHLLGLGGRRHRFVDRPVRIERIIVPDPGLVLGEFLHPWMERRIACHTFSPDGDDKKVWLSRSALPDGLARIEGEEILERILMLKGWVIFHPETESVQGQLRMLEDASVIAGFAGSAFHTLLLGRGIRARIVILSRGSAQGISKEYAAVASAKGLDQRIVQTNLELTGGVGPKRSWRLGDPTAIAELLGRHAER
jgi:hypothetical protein